MLISLIAPAYNEEGNIAPFAESAAAAFSALPEGWAFELIFIDDGSSDRTLSSMHAVLEDASIEKSGLAVSVVEFSRNFGKEAALYAGLEHAKGDICVLIDTDMQQPPAVARQAAQLVFEHVLSPARRFVGNGRPGGRVRFPRIPQECARCVAWHDGILPFFEGAVFLDRV